MTKSKIKKNKTIISFILTVGQKFKYLFLAILIGLLGFTIFLRLKSKDSSKTTTPPGTTPPVEPANLDPKLAKVNVELEKANVELEKANLELAKKKLEFIKGITPTLITIQDLSNIIKEHILTKTIELYGKIDKKGIDISHFNFIMFTYLNKKYPNKVDENIIRYFVFIRYFLFTNLTLTNFDSSIKTGDNIIITNNKDLNNIKDRVKPKGILIKLLINNSELSNLLSGNKISLLQYNNLDKYVHDPLTIPNKIFYYGENNKDSWVDEPTNYDTQMKTITADEKGLHIYIQIVDDDWGKISVIGLVYVS